VASIPDIETVLLLAIMTGLDILAQNGAAANQIFANLENHGVGYLTSGFLHS
jgi:hypothetical protein